MSQRSTARLLACALTMIAPACSGAEAHDPSRGGGSVPTAAPVTAPRAPEQYLVILDLSGSITPQERAAMRGFLRTVAQTLSFGDRLVVMKALNDGVTTAQAPVIVNIPLTEFGGNPTVDDMETLGTLQAMASNQAQALLAAPPTAGTDLFATLHEAAQRVDEITNRRSTLVLMSDMLQCTGALCMEGGGTVPDQRWIDRQKRAGVIPNLRGACVVVIGADATTARGVSVRQFWTTYFAAAGASLDERRYVHSVTTPGAILCPQP